VTVTDLFLQWRFFTDHSYLPSPWVVCWGSWGTGSLPWGFERNLGTFTTSRTICGQTIWGDKGDREIRGQAVQCTPNLRPTRRRLISDTSGPFSFRFIDEQSLSRLSPANRLELSLVLVRFRSYAKRKNDTTYEGYGSENGGQQVDRRLTYG
jgi:hypothetical protein